MLRAASKGSRGAPREKVLIVPLDYTRYHSKAFITNACYHHYAAQGAQVDILPALGTHVPVTESEAADMFGDIPHARFLRHNWRADVVSSAGAGDISGRS